MNKMKLKIRFGALLVCVLLSSVPSYGSVPTTAKGMWIWQIWNDENGNLEALISRLKSASVTWVAVKLGDSNSLYDRSTENLYDWASNYGGFAAVIDTFHNNEIKVYGWQYVYGSSQYNGTGSATEADVTNAILDIPGIDGFIIDAEVEFEASGMTAVAAQYLAAVRAAHPKSFVALTSFARVTSQPIPWTTFLASCDANMPQAYWALRPTDPTTEFNAMRSAFESAEQTWINQGYLSSIKPIVPIGCEGPNTGYHEQFGDIQEFCSLVQNAGYVGVSLWEYADLDTMNWRDYTASWQNLPPTVPQVTSIFPADGDSVPAYDSIKVNLNTAIDVGTMNTAFSINPPVSGRLLMNPDFNQWMYIPSGLLAPLTKYTITIDTSAASLIGTHFASAFTSSFVTDSISQAGPSVIAASPQNGGTVVSKAYVEFIVNEPVNLGSIGTLISFVDSSGNKVAFTRDVLQVTSNGLTIIAIRSSFGLTPGMRYTVTLDSGMTDYYHIATRTPFSIIFICDTSQASGGTAVEGFESSVANWEQPYKNPLSYGIDTTATSFGLAYKAYDGFQSGGLQYKFSAAGGLCAVENSQGYDISSSGSVGMWVFGDDSRNELDFILGAAGSTNGHIVPIDTLDWYGWKFVGMWRAKTDTSSETFDGFAVRRLDSAILTNSSIYIDDIQVNGKVTGIQNIVAQPYSFNLAQNYPNPFNPSTAISYQLSASSYVTLKVYDILGREIATLVNKVEQPGSYTVSFNASGLPSGLYFYRLNAGSYSATKKMLMIK